MSRTRSRVALAIWAAITLAWIGSVAASAFGASGGCAPDYERGMEVNAYDWQWLPPGRLCAYAPSGSFLDGPPSVAIEPGWTAPVLVGAGWLVILLMAPRTRATRHPAEAPDGETSSVEAGR